MVHCYFSNLLSHSVKEEAVWASSPILYCASCCPLPFCAFRPQNVAHCCVIYFPFLPHTTVNPTSHSVLFPLCPFLLPTHGFQLSFYHVYSRVPDPCSPSPHPSVKVVKPFCRIIHYQSEERLIVIITNTKMCYYNLRQLGLFTTNYDHTLLQFAIGTLLQITTRAVVNCNTGITIRDSTSAQRCRKINLESLEK